MFAQHRTSDIDPTWILLDSQSAILVFNNPDMLTNIRPSARVLRAVTNGRHQGSNFVGDFPNHGKVWFYHASIASILALAAVRKVCRVIMDTYDEAAMIVHRLDGSEMNSRNMPVVCMYTHQLLTILTMLLVLTLWLTPSPHKRPCTPHATSPRPTWRDNCTNW
jgi:hypothetical protein